MEAIPPDGIVDSGRRNIIPLSLDGPAGGAPPFTLGGAEQKSPWISVCRTNISSFAISFGGSVKPKSPRLCRRRKRPKPFRPKSFANGVTSVCSESAIRKQTAARVWTRFGGARIEVKEAALRRIIAPDLIRTAAQVQAAIADAGDHNP